MHDRVEWLRNQEGYSFDTMRESKETSIARNWLFKVARASESLERLAPVTTRSFPGKTAINHN